MCGCVDTTLQDRDITFLCQVLVQHQFSMPQVVKNWPKVCGVSVDEIGTSFILGGYRKEGNENSFIKRSRSVAGQTANNESKRVFSLHSIHLTLKCP